MEGYTPSTDYNAQFPSQMNPKDYASPTAQPVISVDEDEAFGFGGLHVQSADELVFDEFPLVPHGSVGWSAQPVAPAAPLYTIPANPYGSATAASGYNTDWTFGYHQDVAYGSAPFTGPASNWDVNTPLNVASAPVDHHPGWTNHSFLPEHFQRNPQPSVNTASFIPFESTRSLPQSYTLAAQGVQHNHLPTLPQFVPSGYLSFAQNPEPGHFDTAPQYMPQEGPFVDQGFETTSMNTVPTPAWPQEYLSMGHTLPPPTSFTAEPLEYSLSYGSDTTWTDQYTSPESYGVSPDAAPAFGFETPQGSPGEAGYMPQATATERRASKDALLLRLKREGKSYKQIKEEGAFRETESTLRGRLRNLVKPKEKRVRKPIWTTKDGARRYHNGKRQSNDDSEDSGDDAEINEKKVAWRLVAEYIELNGGSYQFGNTTCKKKWCAIMKR
ncbi:hypothetical protein H2199_004190 [Coniosporium tulheliwenetii]|uniref:Uncharacterized protein n=1 Tax=Coniosporium tulheliwenetii TaxID=3383036 RepID=A0ACC2Z701_9PEZI|nr:hypothetical protein H2199_004190 [Cladosporium sp. JES 115]